MIQPHCTIEIRRINTWLQGYPTRQPSNCSSQMLLLVSLKVVTGLEPWTLLNEAKTFLDTGTHHPLHKFEHWKASCCTLILTRLKTEKEVPQKILIHDSDSKQDLRWRNSFWMMAVLLLLLPTATATATTLPTLKRVRSRDVMRRDANCKPSPDNP